MARPSARLVRGEMMADKDPYTDEARLYALEVAVTKLYVLFFGSSAGLSGGNPWSFYDLHRSATLDSARELSLPGQTPETSDHAADEVYHAAKRLLDMLQEMAEPGWPPRPKKPRKNS